MYTVFVSAEAAVIERLLGLLSKVRQTGPGRFMSRCPAHADSTPSLSVRKTDDGYVLLYCFAGCEAEDILAAIGLTFSDLYLDDMGHQTRSVRARFSASEILSVAEREVMVIGILAADFLEKRKLNESDWLRLSTAVQRIGALRDHVR